MANIAEKNAVKARAEGADSAYLATLSAEFTADWITALRGLLPPAELSALLRETGLAQAEGRVSHDQVVRLYRAVVAQSGDEMMGLWARPVRRGALKYLCTVVLEAQSLGAALHRFAQFWNLLLDEVHLSQPRPGLLRLTFTGAEPNRFGQMLLLKLSHGILSWLAGHELALRELRLPFARPGFAGDYAVIFPAPVVFGAAEAELQFAPGLAALPVARVHHDLSGFLARAPRDWIFTRHVAHSLHLRLRAHLQEHLREDPGLGTAARSLGLSARTLSRHLAREGQSFQAIRDDLRRDLALRDLTGSRKPIEAIAWELGFSSLAVFSRAFRHWTGETPAACRRRAQMPPQEALK
ncbi:AraC family transcriptional regulator [Falsigemmobacter faecalis]|uniref:AraC family transcriptional regulator n=1 Tax=Falsigemmobacter faecalis TaxID=2488730 RepID=A0A3P3DGI7_9RHOB|nr:AraC family transcriptional regulator [Falsigemmobacter faecalis]RRH72786.1 AraC family transcriptional regulator [Falsigemmobacter faecalis]